jgi:hypothetical protein
LYLFTSVHVAPNGRAVRRKRKRNKGTEERGGEWRRGRK